jgi:hypothetical protein
MKDKIPSTRVLGKQRRRKGVSYFRFLRADSVSSVKQVRGSCFFVLSKVLTEITIHEPTRTALMSFRVMRVDRLPSVAAMLPESLSARRLL